jgi:serine/threonine protein phosphatase PrpC
MTDPIGCGRRYLSASAEGGREEQQDAVVCLHAADDATALLVVSDGLGGESGGRIASQQVIKSAQDFWKNRNGVFADPSKDLETLCRLSHDRINEEGAKMGIRPYATIVALYLSGNRAHWIHSGDSRLYRFRGGKFIQRTEDHSLVQLMVTQRLAKEEDMGSHADQGLLVKSLGGDDYREPSVNSIAIGPEDGFLLCTDGFWQRTTVEEMQQLFKAGAEEVAGLLDQAVSRAIERNGPDGDNVTVALALPATLPGAATGGRSIDPKPAAALPLRPASRRTLAIGAAGIGLALFVGLGVFTNKELLNSSRASTDPSPAATPQRSSVNEPRPAANDDQKPPLQVVTTGTPPEASPKPTATPDEQIVAEATPSPVETPSQPAAPSPVETPSQSATPSASVTTIDPRIVGKWQTRADRGIQTWTQDPDGNFTLSGPNDEKGTLSTEDGKIHQYFPSRNLTQELMYEFTGNVLVTTAPDGKRTEWRLAGTLAETTHPTHPRHHVEEKPTFWQRFIHWFPFR